MISELLFPRRCVSCKKQWGSYLCHGCFSSLVYSQTQYCPEISCQKPSIDGWVHDSCAKRKTLTGHRNICDYDGAAKQIIEYYKRRHVRKLLPHIEDIFKYYFFDSEEAFQIYPYDKTLVTAVPMTSLERRIRGFNVAEDLAEIFADIFSYDTIFDLLKKTKVTKPQKDLSKKERLTNLSGVFEFVDTVNLSNTQVILVDDVWTTGATMQECAHVLYTAGAVDVWAITLARGR